MVLLHVLGNICLGGPNLSSVGDCPFCLVPVGSIQGVLLPCLTHMHPLPMGPTPCVIEWSHTGGAWGVSSWV